MLYPGCMLYLSCFKGVCWVREWEIITIFEKIMLLKERAETTRLFLFLSHLLFLNFFIRGEPKGNVHENCGLVFRLFLDCLLLPLKLLLHMKIMKLCAECLQIETNDKLENFIENSLIKKMIEKYSFLPSLYPKGSYVITPC